jgi:hypothetical protein
MADILSQLQRAYVQSEGTFGTVPNTTGTATLANSDAIRINSGYRISPVRQRLIRPDKFAGYAAPAPILGKRSSTWVLPTPICGGSAAGVAPDMGPLLTALFGATPTVVADTSVAYGLTFPTTIPSVTLWDFWQPSGAVHHVARGCIVQRAQFRLTQEFGSVEFSGQNIWSVSSNGFAGEETAAKGGLTAFPSEPGSPAVVGDFCLGFGSSCELDSVEYATSVLDVTIDLDRRREIYLDNWAYYGVQAADNPIGVAVTVRLYDSDSSDFKALKNKAITGTAIDAVIVFGSAAGGAFRFSLRDIVLTEAGFEEGGNRRVCTLSGTAHGTSPTYYDQLDLYIS